MVIYIIPYKTGISCSWRIVSKEQEVHYHWNLLSSHSTGLPLSTVHCVSKD